MYIPEIQKSSENKRARLIIIIISAIIAAILVVSSIIAIWSLTSKKVYKGVLINKHDMSYCSYDEALKFLESAYSDNVEDASITLNYDGAHKTINFSDITVSYDIKDAVEKAYSVGRSGNIFSRLKVIFDAYRNGIVIPLGYSYDDSFVNSEINDFYTKTLIPVKEADLFLGKSKVTLSTGHPGTSIDKKEAILIIDNSIRDCISGTFDVPSKTTMPSSIDADKIYGLISQEAEDSKVTVENNIVSVIPHTLGRRIDKAELISIINELQNTTDTVKELPVEFKQPEITTEYVNNNIFRDTLASYSTSFSTSTVNNANRGVNIRLASSKLNGKILAPGELFSFNDVVGKRTVEAGYKAAHAYIQGKIVDDVGGGICQVSSTLFNAVLFSDLETVYRKNHMFTVGYVPLGQDAAVSYGELDFEFRNNTKWPIKIEAIVSNSNRLTFSFIGTNETPDKKVEISHIPISTTAAPVRYIDDPNMEEGKTVVIQSGMSGHTVDTYKIIKMGDNVVGKTKLYRSIYSTYDSVIKRGTKKVAPSDSTPSHVQSTPVQDQTIISD